MTKTNTALVAILCLTMQIGGLAQSPGEPIDRTQTPYAVTAATLASAERVVIGRVVAVEPLFFQNEWGDELIISRTTVAVDETLKGAASGTVDVMVEGGTIGELTFKVSDIEPIELGNRGVFMLRQHRSGLLVPHGRGRGLLRLTDDGRVANSALTVADLRAVARRTAEP